MEIGKSYPGLSHEELIISTRIVMGAILLAIPFPFSLVDWFFRLTRIGSWFSREERRTHFLRKLSAYGLC